MYTLRVGIHQLFPDGDVSSLSSLIVFSFALPFNLRSSGDTRPIIIIMVSFYIAHIQCSVCFTHIIPLVTGPVHSCTISTPFLEHTALAAISALGANRTHFHLCPTRYSFTHESSEAY